MKNNIVNISKNIKISNVNSLVLIAGPCVIENESKTLSIAGKLKEIACSLNLPFIFKASYDKANRSSFDSYRGSGLKKGLNILANVKQKYNIPILTDVHCCEHVKEASKIVDILQVPAFLCRQTDLICACAETGLPVNIKKGQFLAPEDIKNIADKILKSGNKNILFTERGTSFGYHNLVVDMRSLAIMKNIGYPVIFDATHSVQLPGGMGKSTGGQREFIMPLSRAAVSLGIAGVFIEVHPNPDKALSDGSNSLSLNQVKDYLEVMIKIDNLLKKDINNLLLKRRYL